MFLATRKRGECILKMLFQSTRNTSWSFVVVSVATTVVFIYFYSGCGSQATFLDVSPSLMHLLTSGDLGGYTQRQKGITLCCSTCRFSSTHLNKHSLLFLTNHCQNDCVDNTYEPRDSRLSPKPVRTYQPDPAQEDSKVPLWHHCLLQNWDFRS